MEKARKGMKPAKLPASLFKMWREHLDSYKREYPNVKFIPTVNAFEKLVDQKSWDAQAACIKEAAKSLKKSPDMDQVEKLVTPLAIMGYFGAEENLSRRTFIPIIEACSQFVGKADALSLYYHKYLDPSDNEFREKPYSQKALAIYATLSFTLGHQLVVNHYVETLRFLVTALEHGVAELKTGSHTAVERDQSMNDVQFSLKTVLVLLARSLEVNHQLFEQVVENKDPVLTLLFGKLVSILLDLCVDTSTFIKECNQVAGMAIGAIINLSNNAEFARDWILGWFFTTGSDLAIDSILNVSPSQALVGPEGWASRDAPMIFILRGLVSSLRREVAILDCPSDIQLVPTLKKSSYKNIHELLFTSVNLFCERPELDSACKVITFESMATWLQQTKDLMDKCTDAALMDKVSGPIERQNMDQLVHYVCDHWDDPIDSLHYKMRTIFELALDTFDIKTKFYNKQAEYADFVDSLLKMLLMTDWHRKVKYALLNMMVEKVESTDALLLIEPHLIEKCLFSMDGLVLSPQITSFILSFLYRRIQDKIPGHADFKGHNGKIKDETPEAKTATQEWIDVWANPLLKCLTSASDILRRNASGFILQPLFKISPQAFWYTIRVLQDTQDARWKHEFNSAHRLSAFIAVLKSGRGLDIVDGSSYTETDEPNKISVDTLKLAIYHADSQVRIDVLGLLCESRKATAPVTKIELNMMKLFLPLNMNSTAPEFRQQLCAHLSKLLMRLRGNLYSQHRTYKSLLVYADKHTDEKQSNALLDAQDNLKHIDQGEAFLNWLCDHVANSLYPGASYQRVATALRILNTVGKVFGITELPRLDKLKEQPDFPFRVPIATSRFSKLLIDALMNRYDFNRSLAFDILCQFPSPLPGMDDKGHVQDLLWWGLNNVTSTRAGESDSGAMVFRLIFTKYVVGLGYDLSPERSLSSAGAVPDAAVAFTEKLLDLLEKQVTIAKTNLLLAAQQHPMHGTLLALQYIFSELNYTTLAKDDWRKTHTRALALIHLTCDTVMEVLSDPSPEGNVPSSFRDMEETMNDLIQAQNEEDSMDESGGPKHQVILSCCWRAVKEASSLLEVIVSKAPASENPEKEDAVISYQDLITSGGLFKRLLTCIRHRGAFSAVYPAYVSLNTRLITCRDPALSQLPGQWLDDNLDSLTSSNISITRRSAGLPLCILAIVSSESGTKKTLLSKAMHYLLELASAVPPADADQRIDLPQVHAYNIMRTIFMDSKLGTHVLEYASDGFSLAINGFSSFSWAIRNCSVMLFSTLLQRTFGTKKIKDEHSTVNTLTGREFFVRFPDLHPYLLKELEVAMNQLSTNDMGVHPGLFPILTLLSRMQPTKADGDEEKNVLSPFVPLVMPCAASAIYKTREMAARALVPLIVSIVPIVQSLLEVTPGLSQNEIHGRFLQAQFLLRGHFYSHQPKTRLAPFIEQTPQLLLELLPELTQERFCHMNSATLLTLVNEFFIETKWLEKSAFEDYAEELQQLALTSFKQVREQYVAYCIEHMKDDKPGIGSYLLRQAMANIIVTHSLQSDKVDDVLFLITDRDYEVRLLVLEKLLSYFSQNSSSKHLALQCILVERTYSGEDNLNCYVLIARLLMTLDSNQPFPTDKLKFSLTEYWNTLVQQFNEKKSLSVTESVLPLLGALISQLLTNKIDNEWVQTCVSTYCGYIKKYSQKEITLPLREAVVKSISYSISTVLSDKSPQDARIQVELALIELLQDDDVDVRQDTANIVSGALHLSAPVLYERGVELVYRELVKEQSQSLVSILAERMNQQVDLVYLWESETGQRALFEKENPNIYKEELIDVQWTAMNLSILTKDIPLNTNISALMQSQAQFYKLIKSMTRTFMQKGPFGITARENVFSAAYQSITYLNIVLENMTQLPSTMKSSAQELLNALKLLQEAWIHPLLWELLQILSNKLGSLLRLQISQPLFLLAPDSKHI
ncbi:hypothetical protein K501DRAFT_235278 [Backusella circina FSU 941]|nr:hypothetical protein K501DRAFT_235278 [Backusella circina FSU 941]